MSVHFNQTEYSVNEEDTVDVCVMLIGNIELNVSLLLSAGELSDLPDSMRANCESLHLNLNCHLLITVEYSWIGFWTS